MTGKLAMITSQDRAEHSDADRNRLTRMFATHHETVWRTLRRRGLSPDEAADVTQETFLIVAERMHDIHPLAERSFLLATALRVVHTQRRKTVRWQLDDAMHLRVADSRDASDTSADVDLCDMILSKIEPELAEVFVLYEAEGLSSREIAELLNIPRGSVASRLRRAREQFRTLVSGIRQSMRREENR